MTKVMNKTQELKELVRKHPDWTYRQYAESLGQSPATVRSVLKRLGLNRFPRGRPRKVEIEAKFKKKVFIKNTSATVASRSSPSNFGYLKLI